MMLFLTSLLVLVATTAQAHYTFPMIVVNGKPEIKDWSVTRLTKNVNSKSGVESVQSSDIRCYQSKNADNITTIPAGATIHYISTQQVNHPGPFQFYLAKVPDGKSAASWDGSGNVWFKFHTEMPSMTKDKQLTWPGQNEYKTTNATIPKGVPSGEYLLRVEHIALHLASAPNKAQFYLSCSQVKIVGDGNGTPAPLVAFPGAYKTNDPGILVNLGAIAPDSYMPPGPPVWSG
ncbi:glycoside hydrolase family 61 protein [Tricladium varicosporioides]|nr:glycoside hydrolase family 61 protein [Hymenoscyphus varicosporioides]